MVNVYIYIELISIVNAIFVDIMGYMGVSKPCGYPAIAGWLISWKMLLKPKLAGWLISWKIPN